MYSELCPSHGNNLKDRVIRCDVKRHKENDTMLSVHFIRNSLTPAHSCSYTISQCRYRSRASVNVGSRISETANLLGFLHTRVSRVQTDWVQTFVTDLYLHDGMHCPAAT